MVLSTTKRTSSRASATNQNQGGGNKKAGLWPQIGRESYTSVVMGVTTGLLNGRCAPCSMTMNLGPLASRSRPIGSVTISNGAWRIPGAN
jgi:hypothetical protein